jgi:hypothetical protein
VANRENHYEAAFEGFLRSRRIPYIAVDESRRSLLAGSSLKSLDFIVSPEGGPSWLVDVKGRRFPSGRGRYYWRNWSTRDDVVSLARWQDLFGSRFCGLLVFAYNVIGDRSPLPERQLYEYRGRRYGFVAVRLAEYAFHARQLNAKWDTLTLPGRRFRELAVPLDNLIPPSQS